MNKWLVNYIRSCFCKHKFVREEGWQWKNNRYTGKSYLLARTVLYCKKCGYRKSWWRGVG